jgi:DNA-binding GntR family transcriptional regulator
MEFSTKNNYVYENLKDEIIDGKLLPGERIVISEVAKRYNVSAMPIREAINRLNQDGFVEVIPHVGAKVYGFDPEKHKEVMQVRVELETLAARLSAQCIDEPTISRLEEIISKMEASIHNKDNIQYGKLNKEFHLTIYAANSNRTLYELIETLWNRSEFSRRVFIDLSFRNEESLKEHKDWLQAIKEKDGKKSAEILREQKDKAVSLHLKELEKYKLNNKF